MAIVDTPATAETSETKETKETKQKRFPVVELFGPVIQGEGSQAGNQTMFIRFGGCDYRCKNCDSMHSVMPEAVAKHASYLTADEILEGLNKVREATGIYWVTFTGGNPAMHQLGELVDKLRMEGWFINVETQGTLCPEWLTSCTLVTVSPKATGMGEKFEQAKFRKFLRSVGGRVPVCVKVVAFAEQDLEFALSVESIVEDVYTSELDFNYAEAQRGGVAYYLSLGNYYPPVLNEDLDLVENPILVEKSRDLVHELLSMYRRLSEEVLQDPRLKKWRFLPQLHVLMYGNEAQR